MSDAKPDDPVHAYRARASELMERARRATDPDIAAHWRDLAEAWLALVRFHDRAGGLGGLCALGVGLSHV